MKKRLLKVTGLLLMTAGLSNCARQEALVMPQFPQQVRAASDLQSIPEVTLNKAQVLSQLSKNTISFSRDEIPGELIIEFSNGRITKPYPGRYRMHLEESGVSTIYVSVTFGPYKPLALSKAETAGLLKSSLNYSQLAAKINEFLK